ncbi:MIP/aquaporin family protein [Candidatus Schneideria nysicola]|uniref:MIP/aquaporin family protein n=1 Tax=Candidatus Schneideria nysicola TaxID=1081631 RepID=UPI001CAA64A2|nr:MIP/aquaporin family protein [Candidatus Schneideria nysicola]UAJ64839.1 aquaporin family protein [Candidatus Schneideria nysicola]UAJ65373.1 aquaporin family protein [Candidatus Schneideria nysicola]UAJ65904.1 aquaporin family protein [Candidatus Schneideria nysicola]
MNQIDLSLKGQCIAEFFGTGLLVFFGIGSVVGMKIMDIPYGQWEICMIWGLSATIAIYFASPLSGAHLNPAVTVAFWLSSSFQSKKVIPYIFSQMLGAFFATVLVYILYYNCFYEYIHSPIHTHESVKYINLINMFSTYPDSHISFYKAFFIETIITSILLCLILFFINIISYKPFLPLLIGIVITLIGSSVGKLTGFALNPARDLSPKIFTYLIGWGSIAFTGGTNIPYFLVPLFAPILGGCLGALTYNKLIKPYLPKEIIEKSK